MTVPVIKLSTPDASGQVSGCVMLPVDLPDRFELELDDAAVRRMTMAQISAFQPAWLVVKKELIRRGYEVREWYDMRQHLWRALCEKATEMDGKNFKEDL